MSNSSSETSEHESRQENPGSAPNEFLAGAFRGYLMSMVLAIINVVASEFQTLTGFMERTAVLIWAALLKAFELILDVIKETMQGIINSTSDPEGEQIANSLKEKIKASMILIFNILKGLFQTIKNIAFKPVFEQSELHDETVPALVSEDNSNGDDVSLDGNNSF